jgi:transposase InsO family protein
MWHDKRVYVATVIDVYTREVVGIAVSLRKGVPLTLQALYGALFAHPRPTIFHSDNGREYDARVFKETLVNLGVLISRSLPGSPWQNGYQESFYDKFKIDLGDPNRCDSLGHLVAEIYRCIWKYNHTRIHSALKMPPRQFAQLHALATLS